MLASFCDEAIHFIYFIWQPLLLLHILRSVYSGSILCHTTPPADVQKPSIMMRKIPIYTHTYIYMNGELFITVDYMRSQVTWHTCLHAELMHLKINTKIWNMPCHAFVVSPRWTIVNRGRCSHPIVITFRCWMCRWKGCISFIFKTKIGSTASIW